jgi:tRNA pseudouridine38-40 synthase
VKTFRLTLEYDGSDFDGWQVQRGGRTVQGALEAALQRVTGQTVAVVGSGRTDAGVHASGQVASLCGDIRFDAEGLRRALNGVLPPDVAVVDAAPARDGFHARHDARSKIYAYRIWSSRNPSPLRARSHDWLPIAVDLDAMARAARHCRGRHDFASFQAAGSDVASSVRTISRLEVTGESPGEIEVLVEGDGFLRHMVRTLVGTLLEVGRGRRPADSLPALLAARDRRRAGPTAPARGLTLLQVSY